MYFLLSIFWLYRKNALESLIRGCTNHFSTKTSVLPLVSYFESCCLCVQPIMGKHDVIRKPEIHNVMNCRQRTTATAKNIIHRKLGEAWISIVSEICS